MNVSLLRRSRSILGHRPPEQCMRVSTANGRPGQILMLTAGHLSLSNRITSGCGVNERGALETQNAKSTGRRRKRSAPGASPPPPSSPAPWWPRPQTLCVLGLRFKKLTELVVQPEQFCPPFRMCFLLDLPGLTFFFKSNELYTKIWILKRQPGY